MSVGEPHEWRLILFGCMRLLRDEEEITGLSDQLFKVLALLVLNGNCMNRETLVERLWPDSSVGDGRHQLRNVLSKLRLSCGLVIDRQGSTVVLRDPIWCDVVEFIVSSTRAVTGLDGAEASRRMGLEAQQLWTGAPLEAWRYEPWAVQVRERAYWLQRGLWGLIGAR